MCLDCNTIYFWALTHKDWVYDNAFVRVSTKAHWDWLFDPQNRSAYTLAEPGKKPTEKKFDRVHKYGFLSRIVVFEPLEAYRKAGWRTKDKDVGIRRELICKGAVACRWGATRKFGEKANPAEGQFWS